MKCEIQELILLLILDLVSCIKKKLLLNDPNQMESEIQELRTLVTTLKTQVSAIQQSKDKDVSELKAQIASIQQNNGGAQFIRWGKGVCPDNDTEHVYDGFAAGGYFDSKGAGVNHLCLPRDPIFSSSYTGTSYASIYGAEYDTDAPLFGTQNGDDLPCAVCRKKSSATSMMLPGRNKCYPNRTMQYNGYLATSHDGYPSSKEYIWIDEHPDALVAGGQEHEGTLFYSVTATCGSLACPPYVTGKRLTFVVCTK